MHEFKGRRPEYLPYLGLLWFWILGAFCTPIQVHACNLDSLDLKWTFSFSVSRNISEVANACQAPHLNQDTALAEDLLYLGFPGMVTAKHGRAVFWLNGQEDSVPLFLKRIGVKPEDLPMEYKNWEIKKAHLDSMENLLAPKVVTVVSAVVSTFSLSAAFGLAMNMQGDGTGAAFVIGMVSSMVCLIAGQWTMFAENAEFDALRILVDKSMAVHNLAALQRALSRRDAP